MEQFAGLFARLHQSKKVHIIRKNREQNCMKTIYAVEGIVNQDFVGQISYTICLEKTYHKMDIGFLS